MADEGERGEAQEGAAPPLLEGPHGKREKEWGQLLVSKTSPQVEAGTSVLKPQEEFRKRPGRAWNQIHPQSPQRGTLSHQNFDLSLGDSKQRTHRATLNLTS